jgi:hypothetical protein
VEASAGIGVPLRSISALHCYCNSYIVLAERQDRGARDEYYGIKHNTYIPISITTIPLP